MSSVDDACRIIGQCARRDVPLGAMTTYRVGGAAAIFVRADDIDTLHAVARAAVHTGLDVVVVGRGSNMLVSDDGFHGIAVQLGEIGADIALDVDHAVARAGGGVLLPVLARRTAAVGLTGFEWAVGVPGSVGGAVRMNAGGHGSDVASTLLSARIVDLVADRDVEVGPEVLGLRFRGSDLADHQVVVSAEFSLRHGDIADCEAQLADVVKWRRENQPGGQNAGSVFVNPIPGELSAGELIDRLGMRGFRLGTAEVSPKHANFIQADEGGSAADVVAVIDAVRRRVADETGFVLRSEVRLVGFTGRPEASEVGSTGVVL